MMHSKLFFLKIDLIAPSIYPKKANTRISSITNCNNLDIGKNYMNNTSVVNTISISSFRYAHVITSRKFQFK